ncbi:MAG: ABC transporter permease [Paracoccaceae bacterium]
MTAVDTSNEPSRWATLLGRVAGNKTFFVGFVLFIIVLIAAIFAPLLATYDPLAINFDDKLLPPSLTHFFGTDELGRDLYSRILYGARTSLMIGLMVTILAVLIGTPIGLIAGYAGGRFGFWLMRFTDVFIAFPPLLLPIAITAALGQGLYEAMIALSISAFPWYARIVYSESQRVSQSLYVKSAKASGFGHGRILFKHMLPNCWTPAITQASMDFGYTILAAASLSFIGIGAKEPDIEWGLMVATSRTKFLDFWWVAMMPGFAILITVFALNLLGDGVRDLLDPKGDGK